MLITKKKIKHTSQFLGNLKIQILGQIQVFFNATVDLIRFQCFSIADVFLEELGKLFLSRV